jgi:hypothetical protein
MLARLSVLNDVECKRAAELAEILSVNPAVEGHEEEARGRGLEDLGRLCQDLGE